MREGEQDDRATKWGSVLAEQSTQERGKALGALEGGEFGRTNRITAGLR